jgi:hypothetical protein
MLKGPSTMPVLTTTIEVFCLRTGRTFRARGSAVRRERYERAGSEISHYRYLVSCKRCPDTHVLLGTFRAASFDLLGDPIGGLRITQKDRSFGRRRLFTQELFDRKRFPPVETESETEAA